MGLIDLYSYFNGKSYVTTNNQANYTIWSHNYSGKTNVYSYGFKMPDYYSLNFGIAIPNPITATLIGWNGNVSVDRYGQVYVSYMGLSLGKSALGVSVCLNGNWMLQSGKPTANEIYNFLSGHGISVGGGYYGGVNWNISPTNETTNNSLGIGIYTPQFGVSYNYTDITFNRKK